MIAFGTDGWRAVIADEFTFANVRRVAQAYADYLRRQPRDVHAGGPAGGDRFSPTPAGRPTDGGTTVVVGYDTRFLSRQFAEEAARVLAANGLRVLLADRFVPTPAISWAVKEHGAAGGVMITASHNPAEYNGFKIKARYGGSALPSITAGVEEALRENEAAGRQPHLVDFHAAVAGGGVRLFNPWPGYAAQLARMVDLEAVGCLGRRVAVDAMYGAGQGYLAGLLRGAGLDVMEVRGEVNPAFPGVNPEPIEKHLAALREAVARHGAAAGLAVDGDGDRVGAVDEHGRFVDAHRIFALILRHLVRDRGWRGTVAKTFALTEMADKLARSYGLPLRVLPVGFKHVCELALREDVLIGGEESGGIGVKGHMPERDGLLSCLFLLEMMARSGLTLGELVEDLLREVGPHFYRREDLRLSEAAKDALLARLESDPPRAFAGLAVSRVDARDGYKFFLGERGWVLVRASGTEPVVRVYVEMDDPELVPAVLQAGVALARGEEAFAGTGRLAT